MILRLQLTLIRMNQKKQKKNKKKKERAQGSPFLSPKLTHGEVVLTLLDAGYCKTLEQKKKMIFFCLIAPSGV